MLRHNSYRTVLTLVVLLLVLSSVAWAQSPQLIQAIPPAEGEPTGLTVEVTGPAEVEVGDTFTVNVVASNIPDPGIFGYQFALNWDDTVVTPVTGTLALHPDFSLEAKVVEGAADLQVAVSRQGDVEDLAGPLTLLTWTFQANVVTDPDATSLTLTDEKFGRKGGLNVPVEAVVNLDVIVREEVVDDGDIMGNVKVEGRAEDNQAGHSVTLDGLSALTDALGDFLFEDVEFGTYDATANSSGFLAAACAGLDHSTDPTTLNDVVLLAGDIVEDGTIDVADAVAIGIAFGSADETADLNADGVVDILDLILMAVNYEQTSAGNPWLCQ